jgi:6-phosphogluconolactonase/glucosamine-6-phosphate isomerase/deaminase
MEIIYSTTPHVDITAEFSRTIAAFKTQPILLVLSGGSWFTILDLVNVDGWGDNLTVSVLDERFSLDEKVNNFAQLSDTTFFKKLEHKSVTTISTLVALNDSIDSLCAKWESNLRAWKESNPEGVVIATIGIGKDGHVAGMFPGTRLELFTGEDWTAVSELLPEINPVTQRFTTTQTFLTQIVTQTLVYIVGEDKKAILQKILGQDSDSQALPANVLHKMKSVKLFTDIKL